MHEPPPPAVPGAPPGAPRTEMPPPPAAPRTDGGDSIWSTEMPRPPAPGVKIGKYKLLEEIGEGGCGVVYMAEQLEPVRRRVAVKIIRLGMDTQQVIARFEAERQALAVMDHPNIAKVLDAGATETGRPYFVMELIRGIPLVRFCDENRLGVPERLALFMQVCAAVQHAHQKGIIHRDLKPSNVLVTLHDGVPVPKVIDFGIAKATQQPLTDRTLYTAHMEFIGTPAYMSPEQAELSGLDIDTRSDIYSLGVILYELLTGVTPFSAEDLDQAGLDEMRRRIREVEPPTASTRLRTLAGPALTTAAQRRGTTPPKLLSLVRGDLDWIVMKCLEKDRTRRYDSAATLAQDLQRFLAHEPVSAGPPSTLYKLAKFAQRHRPALAAAAAFVLVLLGATVVSLREARRADREAAQANAERRAAEQQRLLAEENRREAERQRQAVIVAYNQADVSAALDRLAADNPNEAAAFLAQALRAVPGNRAAAGLLNSLLLHENWALPLVRFKAPEAGAALDVSPDGRTVITGSAAGGARIWDLGTGQPLTPPLPHNAPVSFVQFSPDGRRALTFEQSPGAGRGRGGPSGPGGEAAARIWNTATGQPVAELAQPPGGPQSFVFSPDGARVAAVGGGRGGRGGQVRVWDTAGGQLVVARPPPQGEGVAALDFSPDGSRLLAVAGGTARVLDAVTLQPAGPALAPAAAGTGSAPRVLAAGFSPDGRRIFTVSDDDAVQLWDAATGQAVFAAPLRHEAAVAGVVFSPDGRRLATFSADKTARVWDAADGEPLSALLRHETPVTAAAFSPDGARLATVAGEFARVWDAPTGWPLTAPLRHENALRAAAFSPDGGRLITTGRGGVVRVWEASATPLAPLEVKLAGLVAAPAEPAVFTREENAPRRGGPSRQNGPGRRSDGGGPGRGLAPRLFGFGAGEVVPRLWAFSPDAARLAVLTGAGVQIFNAATGEALLPPFAAEGQNPVLAVNFSPDGQRIVTAAGGAARLWDAATGRPAGPPLAHEGRVLYAAFSGDSRRVITVAQENLPIPMGVRVWDAATGEPVGEPLRAEGGAGLAALSPDGARAAIADGGYNVKIYDLATGQAVGAPIVLEAPVSALAFSPDGARLLAAAGATARVWDPAAGQPVSAPMMHDYPVALAVFDDTGRRVLTATEAPDDTARVWDAATGQLAARPLAWTGAAAAPAAASFAPGGQDILVAARDNVVRAWPVGDAAPPAWLLDLAETLAQTRLDATRAPVYFSGAPLEALRAQAAAAPAPAPPAVRRAQSLLKALPSAP